MILSCSAMFEKKPKAPKEKKPKMIKKRSWRSTRRMGRARMQIAKHVEQQHKWVLQPNYKRILAVQLKNFASKGKLVKVKALFKLFESEKKEAKLEQIKEKNRHEVVVVDEKKESKATKKPAAAVKSKKAAGMVNVKQPKSIKSPMKKKTAAKKTTA